jgi:class 3 adenylate cyclase
MKCQECGQESRAGARFCEQCGVAVPSRCPACREVVASTAKFCHRCGAAISRGDADATQGGKPIPSAPVDATTSSAGLGDRRHAVVLFADIVGYTAMCAGGDAEPIQLVLGSFFEAMDAVVEAHGGRVFDRAGDAVMAVFGAPVAHGNDAQRALRAALAMHQAAGSIVDAAGAPLRLHVGLASGEVVAAVIGGGTSKYSVTGSAVNLGARLAALA